MTASKHLFTQQSCVIFSGRFRRSCSLNNCEKTARACPLVTATSCLSRPARHAPWERRRSADSRHGGAASADGGLSQCSVQPGTCPCAPAIQQQENGLSGSVFQYVMKRSVFTGVVPEPQPPAWTRKLGGGGQESPGLRRLLTWFGPAPKPRGNRAWRGPPSAVA